MSRFGLFLPILCLLIACKAENEPLSKQSTLPNIVIIFTDDQGYQDVGVFGSKISTPHLDQMAAEGLKLTNYYAAQAVCSASRAALLTGCYPNRIGIHNALMPNANIGLNPDETTLAELLKSRGYATGIFGKWHLGDHPNFLPTAHGFDEWFGIPYSNDMWPYHPQQGTVFNFGPLPLYQNELVIDTLTDQSQLTAQITKKSIEFIERNKENPFFLYVPHPQPHVPLFVSERFKGKSEQGLYGDVIMELDWSVGQIMQALEANTIADNTMVIFTSDNGPWLSYGNHAGSALPFREGKGTAWEGGQREPFLIVYPDSLPRGKTIHAPIMAIDLLPTIAEMVGSPLPDLKIDGKSAWPLLKGETIKSPQDAYFFYYKTNELHAVRQGDWKLYTPHTYRSMKGQLPGKDGLPGLYRQFTLEKHELYNLSHDPEETLNVANENPEIVTKMMHLADSMRNELGDALTSAKGINNREPGRIE